MLHHAKRVHGSTDLFNIAFQMRFRTIALRTIEVYSPAFCWSLPNAALVSSRQWTTKSAHPFKWIYETALCD